ncbi:MAG TPA: hypothetical protein VED40_15645 [Azospirillaceae bacterium]|nr:hypothetical protein [Azospirillaceae bacterium]
METRLDNRPDGRDADKDAEDILAAFRRTSVYAGASDEERENLALYLLELSRDLPRQRENRRALRRSA